MNQSKNSMCLRERICEGSQTAKLLGDYIERSHLQESSEDVLIRAVLWFMDLHEDIVPGKVTFGHADDFRSWLRKTRSGATANTYLAMIGGFFAWLHKRGRIAADPFDGVQRFRVEQKQFDIYSPEEIRRILKVANLYWQAIVCLALCSMRRAEILNLHVTDIDFERNEIHIKPKKRSETTWSWQIKNHNEGLVGIDDSITQLLIRLVEYLEGGRQPYLILKEHYWQRNLDLQASGLLTHDKRNCPWGNFSRDYKNLLKRARVPHKRFHDLRGTFATDRYRDGFELIDLQFLMRHASIQTTARYVQKEDKRKLVRKSGRAFKKYYETNVS